MEDKVMDYYKINDQLLANLCVAQPEKIWAVSFWHYIKSRHITECTQKDLRQLNEIETWLRIIV